MCNHVGAGLALFLLCIKAHRLELLIVSKRLSTFGSNVVKKLRVLNVGTLLQGSAHSRLIVCTAISFFLITWPSLGDQRRQNRPLLLSSNLNLLRPSMRRKRPCLHHTQSHSQTREMSSTCQTQLMSTARLRSRAGRARVQCHISRSSYRRTTSSLRPLKRSRRTNVLSASSS